MRAAGLQHAGEESGEDRGTVAEADDLFRVERGDRVVECELLIPPFGEFGVVGGGSVFLVVDDVCGGVFEELAEGGSGGGVGDGFVESGAHVLEPGFSLGGCDVESGVGFAETQPPAVLGLIFVAAEKLDEKGGEFFGSAAEGFAGEEGAEDRIAGDAGIEGLGEAQAGGLAAEVVED